MLVTVSARCRLSLRTTMTTATSGHRSRTASARAVRGCEGIRAGYRAQLPGWASAAVWTSQRRCPDEPARRVDPAEMPLFGGLRRRPARADQAERHVVARALRRDADLADE